MPYRICKTFEVENGHMLSKHPDTCKYPHGHSRKVELILEADELDSNDMVCDFKVVKEAVEEFIMTFDHGMCVNSQDPNYESLKEAYGDRIITFADQDPTTEVMAKVIYDEAKAKLAEYRDHPDAAYPLSTSARIVRVRLWETSSAWAEYGE